MHLGDKGESDRFRHQASTVKPANISILAQPGGPG